MKRRHGISCYLFVVESFIFLVNYSATAKYLCYLCLRKALETGMHERGWGMIADEATKLFAVNLKKQFTILYYVS